MNKVVVTGALGFIGYSLCTRLLESGYEVIGIDGMIDERLKELYEEKLLWMGRNAQFHFINEKIEEINLKQFFGDVDTVYHLAAPTSRDRSWGVLRTTIEDNVGVTGKIIQACGEATKLIYTSSTEVYGERCGIVTEKTPLNPTTPYSLTKMAAESLIRSRCKDQKVPYVIFRLPTIYGPWQRVDMTYHKLLLNETSSSKGITFDHVTEDVLYIDDILDTLIKSGIKKDCKNTIYNLSTSKTNEWFRGFEMITKDRSVYPRDEKIQVAISNEKVVSELGFKVRTSLENGLKAQMNHIEKYKQLYLKS